MNFKVGKVKMVIDDEYVIEGSIGGWTENIKAKTGTGTIDIKLNVHKMIEKQMKGAGKEIKAEEPLPLQCLCGNENGGTHQNWCPLGKEKENA